MLVVHIGAGNHDAKKSKQYKNLLKKAVNSNNLPEASTIVETSELTNTGYGSCLNLMGQVECDASFINVQGTTVTQGSLVGIDTSTTPIETTINIYQDLKTMYCTTNMNNLGLTMPIKINYKSYSLYRSCGENHNLVLPHSRQFYEKYKDRVLQGIDKIPLGNIITDTIGVIEINDDSTKIATSSGGNFFKVPGRIGCAGEIGGAIDYRVQNGIEISCVCSGNGEDILQMKLAGFVVNNFGHDLEYYGQHLVDMIQQHAAKFNLLAKGKFDDEAVLYVGVIVIVNDTQSDIKRLIYCHSTESFYFGFRNSLELEPNIVLSRLDNTSKTGKVFAYGEFKL